MSAAYSDARVALDDLRAWVAGEAYPRWWDAGTDRKRGGFFETVGQDGTPQLTPRRARVQPRQIFAFAIAGKLGWEGPTQEAVRHGLDFFLGHYTRPDGFFRTLVAADGKPMDETVVLYDQAFALFGLCQAYQTLGHPTELKVRAETLRDNLIATLHHPMGGFYEWPRSDPPAMPLLSNPHMHLFEACLAWAQAGGDKVWKSLADEIAQLALSKFIDPKIGALREFFAADWSPAPGVEGRIVEPGHQFEWGWLLLRWGSANSRQDAIQDALRMIEIGEEFGVDRQNDVAINQLLDDFSVHDGGARLWPQTERIKAHALAARLTGSEDAWLRAARAARGLQRYFAVPATGLWRDKLRPDGTFVEEPAPASSFYHIALAISELEDCLRAALPD